jgi:two-component system, NtrC family, response regulator AtoC
VAYTVFIVDDEQNARTMLGEYIESLGYEVHLFASGKAILAEARDRPPHMAVLDVNLPDLSGIDVLKALRILQPTLPCLMVTGDSNHGTMVEALKSGAFDFLAKPLNYEQLRFLLEKAEREIRERIKREVREQREGSHDFSSIMGESMAMQKVKKITAKVAASSAKTVLIRGETGTGKELFARALHFHSDRRDEPFIEVNCSAIPAQLLESELFGHEKGAFTDAKERKIGLIERAHGGTFFLDEIGDMDSNLQAKILRVLEDRSIRRVGGDQSISVDIRFVAATHKDLEEMITQKLFREDLYFRLNIIMLDLPPLRERDEDIPLLGKFFLNRFTREHNNQIRGFSQGALEAMSNYHWPGNVRELRNTIERAVLIEAEEWVEAEHLRLWRRRAERPRDETRGDAPRKRIGYDFEIPDEGFSLDEFEKILLTRAMKKSRYNVSKAARMLGLSRETMRYRIKKHDLDETIE